MYRSIKSFDQICAVCNSTFCTNWGIIVLHFVIKSCKISEHLYFKITQLQLVSLINQCYTSVAINLTLFLYKAKIHFTMLHLSDCEKYFK